MSKMQIRNDLTDLLFFSCICLVVGGCSWILPAIKATPSESVVDYEGETVALIVDTVQRPLESTSLVCRRHL